MFNHAFSINKIDTEGIKYAHKMQINLFYVILPIVFCGCQHRQQPVDHFNICDLQDTISFPIRNNAITIKIPQPSARAIKTSEIIDDFKYIPMETKDECLIGQYREVFIFDQRIFIQDIETKMAYIFTLDGKFINKIGKQGNAPNEYIRLTTITLDKYNKHLVAYDQFLKRIFYYDLDGKLLYIKKAPLNFRHDIHFIAPDQIVFAKDKIQENSHLRELNECSIIYADTALNILGGTYKNDLNYIDIYSPKCLTSNRENVAFVPIYSPDFYEITPNGINHKYHFDYTGFPHYFNTEKVTTFSSEDDKMNYLYTSTCIIPPVFFTDNFLWFKIQMPDQADQFYCYYDKESDKALSIKEFELEFDTDCVFSTILATHDDYLVGYILPSSLINFKEACDKVNRKLRPDIADMIDSLQSDDNGILVLMKLKPLQ